MNRSLEAQARVDLAVPLADDDLGHEYEELTRLEELGGVSARSDREGALLEVAGELALIRDELEELAALEDRAGFASPRSAEGDDELELAMEAPL